MLKPKEYAVKEKITFPCCCERLSSFSTNSMNPLLFLNPKTTEGPTENSPYGQNTKAETQQKRICPEISVNMLRVE